MNVRRILYVLLCLAAATLSGCNSGNGVGAMPINTQVRVVNLIPNAPAITVVMDSTTTLVSGLGFEQQTLYLDVTSGTHDFVVTGGSSTSTLVNVMEDLANGQPYTLVVYGPMEAASSQFLTDGPISFVEDGLGVTIPNAGTFAIRLANVASGVGALDLYLTTPGADLSLTAPTIVNTSLGVTTVFTPVNTGTYELRITTTGTKNVVYDTQPFTFTDQSIVQFVAYGKGSSKLVGVDLLNLDTQGSGQFLPSLLAQFKLVNASSVGTPLNVLVNGALTLTNIPFAGVSNYTETLAGSQTLSVESAATPGASLLTFTPNFAPATDSSIVVTGSAGALQVLVLTDNNMPSPVGRARVRFVNASPGLAALDVYVNFALTFSGVASDSASPYTELVANITGTPFTFGFNFAGTTTPALTLPNITLIAGTTYTIYVVGQASSPQGVVVSDSVE